MVSGNPPRHSKSADEPVTIDLDAQEIRGCSRYREAGSSITHRLTPARPTADVGSAAAGT